jgi:hypothetical protein
MTQRKKTRLVPVEVASAQRAGGLISDFMMQRIVGGWCVLLVETGNTESLVALARKNVDPSDENAATFPTADEALATIYQIGFDVSRNSIGMWHPEPKHMERLQKDTMKSLEEAMDTLQKIGK